MHDEEGIIEASVWGIMIIALLLFVPKKRMREASAVYLFKLLYSIDSLYNTDLVLDLDKPLPNFLYIPLILCLVLQN
ncbi:MAG: hypothetical protein JWM44_3189 [Bacilli bacterium]|nr:hypothetical protein [Bacilli bacterium]